MNHQLSGQRWHFVPTPHPSEQHHNQVAVSETRRAGALQRALLNNRKGLLQLRIIPTKTSRNQPQNWSAHPHSGMRGTGSPTAPKGSICNSGTSASSQSIPDTCLISRHSCIYIYIFIWIFNTQSDTDWGSKSLGGANSGGTAGSSLVITGRRQRYRWHAHAAGVCGALRYQQLPTLSATSQLCTAFFKQGF